MAAFTLIVCGESFVEVALAASHETIHQVDVVSLTFEFLLIFALFTSYFEDLPVAGLNQRRFGWWACSHLVAQICIAAIAVSVAKLVDFQIGHHLPEVEILKLTVPLAVLYLALAGIGASSRRRPVAPLAIARLATAGTVAVVGVVAWLIPWIHMVEALPLFVAVAGAHAWLVARLRTRTALVEPTGLRGRAA